MRSFSLCDHALWTSLRGIAVTYARYIQSQRTVYDTVQLTTQVRRRVAQVQNEDAIAVDENQQCGATVCNGVNLL